MNEGENDMFDEYRAIVQDPSIGHLIDIVSIEDLDSDFFYPSKVVTIEDAIQIVKNNPNLYCFFLNHENSSLVEFLKKKFLTIFLYESVNTTDMGSICFFVHIIGRISQCKHCGFEHPMKQKT